jgi:hypothetical protein
MNLVSLSSALICGWFYSFASIRGPFAAIKFYRITPATPVLFPRVFPVRTFSQAASVSNRSGDGP